MNAGAMPSCVVSKIEDAAAGYMVCDTLWCARDELLTAGDDYCVKMWELRRPRSPVASYMGHTSSAPRSHRFFRRASSFEDF